MPHQATEAQIRKLAKAYQDNGVTDPSATLDPASPLYPVVRESNAIEIDEALRRVGLRD